MRSRPYEERQFDLDDLLDDIFQLPSTYRYRLQRVFNGEETLDMAKSGIMDAERPGDSEWGDVDYDEVMAQITSLKSDSWQKVRRVLVPTATRDIGKIQAAIYDGSNMTVKWHLEGKMFHQKFEVDAADERGDTLLHMASFRNFSLIDYLLEREANPLARNARGVTSLMCVAHNGVCGVDRMSKLLVERGGRVNSQDEDGFAALHVACRQVAEKHCIGFEYVAKNIDYLLGIGADPRLRAKHKEGTPEDCLHSWIKISGKLSRQQMATCDRVIEKLRTAETRIGQSSASVETASPVNPSQLSSGNNPILTRLEILQRAFEQGLINQQEYDEKRKKLIGDL